ncbi:hypothetical protein [Oryza sativa Japonica Group]|uniref:Uncharacterized protein n=1 Tax=Oryza sativa subsp. japonica TaxID=39947 RepID=Q5QMB1_ORYSJ|nr:hypothetical protein [Oryza sativa Japonica Group]
MDSTLFGRANGGFDPKSRMNTRISEGWTDAEAVGAGTAGAVGLMYQLPAPCEASWLLRPQLRELYHHHPGAHPGCSPARAARVPRGLKSPEPWETRPCSSSACAWALRATTRRGN